MTSSEARYKITFEIYEHVEQINHFGDIGLNRGGEFVSYYNVLFKPAIIQEVEQNQNCKLNFENEESQEQRELAHQDLKAAKVLSEASKNASSDEIHQKKALNRKAKQIAMEATEHAQKAITFADDQQQMITNSGLHEQLRKSHNNSFMQREHEKVGINILEKDDIDKLNAAVKKKNGEKSPYNAVRFTSQEIDDRSVDNAIEVAEKAIENLDKKVEESKKKINEIGDQKFVINI